ncbi:UNVERIFIED_ORG: biotin operon repressor [Heyndrickxia coagulans]
MPRKLVDPETGQVFDNVVFIRTKEQQKAWQDKKRVAEPRRHSFTFSHMENTKEVISMSTTVELGYFLMLQTFIDYENNMLVKSQKDKIPMSRRDIGKVLGISNRSIVKKHIDNFLEKGLLTTKQVTVNGKEYTALFVNPKYHFKGATNNAKVVKTFSSQIRKLYSHKGIKPADMGFLYLLIPYLHMKDNTLCSNPYEPDVKKVDALSMSEISEITGLDRKNVLTRICRLKWDGMRVFAKVVTGKETHLKVNPRVFWRQDGEPPQVLVDMFLIKGK